MESDVRMDLVIYGRVQGVNYRYSAKIKAESLNIKGSVKNMHDGSVFLTVQGEKEAINNFVKWCYIGPPGSKVIKIEKVHGETEDFRGFSVLY